MRAYLLGYNHGKNDGYYSTLIERGGCEKSYDESLDVEYVTVDKVLELIDELNDTKALVKATPPGSYLHKTYARRLKGAVKELAGEGTD